MYKRYINSIIIIKLSRRGMKLKASDQVQFFKGA